jgi:single-stranded-DNA-specific exonuclease
VILVRDPTLRSGGVDQRGGHKMAAGLTVTRDRSTPRWTTCLELLAKQGANDIGPADLKVDGLLMPGAATVDLIN